MNIDGREKRKRKEDKVTDVSAKEKNNQSKIFIAICLIY